MADAQDGPQCPDPAAGLHHGASRPLVRKPDDLPAHRAVGSHPYEPGAALGRIRHHASDSGEAEPSPAAEALAR